MLSALAANGGGGGGGKKNHPRHNYSTEGLYLLFLNRVFTRTLLPTQIYSIHLSRKRSLLLKVFLLLIFMYPYPMGS